MEPPIDHKAVEYLEDELENINVMFHSGEMNAFGTQQEIVLKELTKIREMQSDIALKQIALFGRNVEKKQEDYHKDEWADIFAGVDFEVDQDPLMADIVEKMNALTKSIEDVNAKVKKL